MNKTKMILAGTGGAIGLVVLVLAFLVWQGFSAKTAAIEGDDEEGVDGYETVVGRAETLSRKPVYPSAASVTAIESNRTVLTEWTAEARKLASRGDRIFNATTPAAFKAFIVGNVAMLREGTNATARILKPDFAFGPFKGYIAEGKLPAENELAELQRKWDDVVTVTELLAESGVSELVDVQFKAKAAEETTNEKQGTGKKAKPVKKGASKSNNQTIQQSNVSFSYVFTFTARPAALVKAVNALGTCERFIAVEDFTFVRPGDVIAEALGGDEKKKEAAQAAGGRRGRRGRRGADQPDATAPRGEGAAGTEKTKNGIVTDPLLDAPLSVVMTVTVHDFRSLEEEGK